MNFSEESMYKYKTWIRQFLNAKGITMHWYIDFVYVRKNGEELLSYNRATQEIKLFTDEFDFADLKGIMELL